MDIVVGHDLTTHGDAALALAVEIASAEDDLAIGVVHVITQQELDKTGKLDAKDKREAAIEAAYPRVWRRVEAVAPDDALSTSTVEVLVRLAPVHLVRSQGRIAQEIVRVAKEYGAQRIVLGRRGRPGGVAEALVAVGRVEEPAGEMGPFVVQVDPLTLASGD